MLIRLFKSDTFVLVLLLILGAFVIGAAFVSARTSAFSLVRSDASVTASRLAGEIGTLDREAHATSGPEFATALRWRLDAQPWTAVILAYSVHDETGHLVLSSDTVTAGGLRGSGAPPTVDIEALKRALAGRETIEVEHPAADPDRTLAHVARPLSDAAGRTGALLVTLDQSDKQSLLGTALDAIAGLMAALIWIAIGVPTFVVWRRIKEQWSSQEQIRHLAHHDALTDLPNRTQLNDALVRALARARRRGTRVAVICLDLDRFKEVNDTLGHPAGDALLKSAAMRLLACVREVDTVARLGGDEFAVVAEDFQSGEDVIVLAERLCQALAEPHEIDGDAVPCTASLGVAVSPQDGTEPVELIKNADLALYRSKQEGRGGFRFFEQDMDRVLQERRLMERNLRAAIEHERFSLHYQPQFDLETGALCGHEALLRWRNTEGVELLPAQFIPVAEETGLIIPLGRWVLRRACIDAMTWPPHLKVAVNLSPVQFKSGDVASIVAESLRESGLAPERLELEITERLLLSDTDGVLDQLSRLDQLGVGIAMDDFGTGYSSLSYLSRFPFSKIKIDGSFVRAMCEDANTRAIVSTIVGLGRSLNVTVTAEGVETMEQAESLKAYSGLQVQGFLFGRPADAAETGRRNRALTDEISGKPQLVA